MSDDDLRTPSGFGRTLHQHSGEQFESGTVHRARGVNEPMPDVGVEAAHDDDGFSGGGANYREDGGRRRKLRDTPASKEIVILGKGKTTIFKGTNAVEDERWVYITEIKENGTKAYLCVRCHKSFTGYDAKVISHCLQLKDGSVAPCTQKPTAEARLVLERAKKEKESKKATGGRVGSASASKDQATARTPPIRAAFGGSVQRVEDCDEALAKWAVAHDIAWAAIDSRDHLWVDFVEKLKLASPVWTVPTREVLSADEKRGGEARAGGLYLALTSKDNEKEKILAAAREEGGTAVSDGAKLATRKRGMLNTALVTRFGVIFLQQTDGTGHVKDGEYLANDYGKALEKAGPYTIVQKWTGGKLVKKKKSSVCKLLFTDRGGGCVTALVLMEDLWIIIADGCKVHLADLLIEDCAKPFKGHLKKVHLLILFIINHTFIYAIFVSYAEVLALLIPADTRFATEIICARSLLRDKAQIKRLFVDPKFDEWTAKQDAPTRATTRKMKTLALDDAFWHVTDGGVCGGRGDHRDVPPHPRLRQAKPHPHRLCVRAHHRGVQRAIARQARQDSRVGRHRLGTGSEVRVPRQAARLPAGVRAEAEGGLAERPRARRRLRQPDLLVRPRAGRAVGVCEDEGVRARRRRRDQEVAVG